MTPQNNADALGRAEPLVDSPRAPENERPAAVDRLCDGCGTSLAGRRRQARYCSDRCRSQARRDDLRHAVEAALGDIHAAGGRLSDAVAKFIGRKGRRKGSVGPVQPPVSMPSSAGERLRQAENPSEADQAVDSLGEEEETEASR
jgi:hypothetical protein